MSDGVHEAVVQRGRDAAARGDWQDAYDLLMQADADELMTAAELPVLAEVAYAARCRVAPALDHGLVHAVAHPTPTVTDPSRR